MKYKDKEKMKSNNIVFDVTGNSILSQWHEFWEFFKSKIKNFWDIQNFEYIFKKLDLKHYS